MPIIRVAFVWSDLGWMGGINYFRSLFYALHTHAKDAIEPILFTGKHSDTYGLESYVKVVRSPLLDEKSPAWVLSKCIKVAVGGRELLLRRLLERHHVDIISHYNWLWKDCGIQSLSWIPDFQVLHLPECFPEKERQVTLDFMVKTVQKSDAMLLSSEHAQSDLYSFCEKYLRMTTPHSYVLHFPSSFSGLVESLPSIKTLRDKYHLPDEPWLHVPNQFWQHKNHELIIQALNILQKNGKAPLVIATGKPEDTRNPEYFASLMKKVKGNALDERFLVLGQIPYMDMMALMFHAIAVINPSRFEGWSTTVEEARSFGKKLILSDIPVHQEQRPDRSYYFLTDDHEKLAKLIFESVLVYNRKEETQHALASFKHKETMMIEFAKKYTVLLCDLKKGAEA